MSQHGTLKRYSLIIKKVTEDYLPSLAQIIDYLTFKGFEVSKRTIQRDLQQLDQEFGLKITYERNNNGYHITEKDKIQLEPFIRLLDIINTANLLKKSFSESKNTLQHISFDHNDRFVGLEWMKPILDAIRENVTLTFSYQTFFEGPVKDFELQPYLLKEYLSRWYLVGCFKDYTKLYVFGLDRISNLKITYKRFKANEKLNPISKFKDIIGLVNTDDPKERVVLSFTPTQGNYIKTLPIHHSQKKLVDNEKEYRIELYLIPNFELSQKILMYGSAVKVIQPKWLAEQIMASLKEAIKRY